MKNLRFLSSLTTPLLATTALFIIIYQPFLVSISTSQVSVSLESSNTASVSAKVLLGETLFLDHDLALSLSESVVASHSMKKVMIKQFITKLNEKNEYREKFKQIFGVDKITQKQLNEVLAAFEKTIFLNAQSDNEIASIGASISIDPIHDISILSGKGNCMGCHSLNREHSSLEALQTSQLKSEAFSEVLAFESNKKLSSN